MHSEPAAISSEHKSEKRSYATAYPSNIQLNALKEQLHKIPCLRISRLRFNND